jgi:hypothetical protein
MNRRNLLSSLAALTGVAVILPMIANAERKRGGSAAAASGQILVDPKDPQAKAVNYVVKHSDLKDKALQVERSGVKWTDQKCSNCAFYDATKPLIVGGVKAAPCSMPFAAGKVVAQDAWCTTWAKKA